MGIGIDVLATALQELMPDYSELFIIWHPVLEKILLRGQLDRSVLKGPWREFALVQGGPGQPSQVIHGSEVIAGGRVQQGLRGNSYAPRIIYAFDVPGKDLAEANGPQDLARIIQHYPENALADFHELIAQQMSIGTGSGVGGFLTFNGDLQYNPQGALRDGALEFRSRTLQQTVAPKTVFGVNKGTTTGWYNQYGHITSFSGNGRHNMRQVYHRCSRQGKALGPVDLMLADEVSWLAYVDDLDDQVRVPVVKGDQTPKDVRQGIKFLAADYFLEDSIDVTSFTTPEANQGVIYYFKTATWYCYTVGHDASKETKGDFALRGPTRLPQQDMWRFEIILNMGLYCNQLRANGTCTGAHIP